MPIPACAPCPGLLAELVRTKMMDYEPNSSFELSGIFGHSSNRPRDIFGTPNFYPKDRTMSTKACRGFFLIIEIWSDLLPPIHVWISNAKCPLTMDMTMNGSPRFHRTPYQTTILMALAGLLYCLSPPRAVGFVRAGSRW